MKDQGHDPRNAGDLQDTGHLTDDPTPSGGVALPTTGRAGNRGTGSLDTGRLTDDPTPSGGVVPPLVGGTKSSLGAADQAVNRPG